MFAIKITSKWTKSSYLYPIIYETQDEAETAVIPQRVSKNDIFEVIDFYKVVTSEDAKLGLFERKIINEYWRMSGIKCKIHMFESGRFLQHKPKESDSVLWLYSNNELLFAKDKHKFAQAALVPQDLYFTTPYEAIYNNDWFITKDNLLYNLNHKNPLNICKTDQKVIMATDKTLTVVPYLEVSPNHSKVSESGPVQTLPQPSQAFLEKYVNAFNRAKRIHQVVLKFNQDEVLYE